jgi:hypothetical protein
MSFSNYGANENDVFCGNLLLLFILLRVMMIMDELLFEVK